jgi:transcriptional regulator with XRE-family HTH domain
MTVIMNIVADNMRLFRDNKHLSQKEVALSVGIPQGQYSRIENGKIEPSLSTLEKLTNFFGIPMAELFQTKDSLTNLMTEEASARYTCGLQNRNSNDQHSSSHNHCQYSYP